MSRGSGVAWVVALMAVVGLAGALLWGFAVQRDALALNERLAVAENNAAQLKIVADEQGKRVEDLMAKVEDLEKQAAAAPPVEPGESATAGAEQAAAPPAADAAQGGPAQFMKMFEGEEGKKFAEASAEAAVSMQYADLLAQLALPAEQEQKVHQILRDFMVRQMQAGMELMKSGKPEDGKKLEEEMNAELRKELSQVLNENGLAMYDEYQEGMAERMVRKSFDMQIGMLAPALTAENKTMVLDVLVEEMMAAGKPDNMEFMNSPEAAKGQLEALDCGRERLSTVLEEQQMAQVDRFIQQQRVGLEMFQQMMSGKPAEPAAAEK